MSDARWERGLEGLDTQDEHDLRFNYRAPYTKYAGLRGQPYVARRFSGRAITM